LVFNSQSTTISIGKSILNSQSKTISVGKLVFNSQSATISIGTSVFNHEWNPISTGTSVFSPVLFFALATPSVLSDLILFQNWRMPQSQEAEKNARLDKYEKSNPLILF
jgi:hypothetical protein